MIRNPGIPGRTHKESYYSWQNLAGIIRNPTISGRNKYAKIARYF